MDFNGRNDLSYGLVPVIIVFEVPLREKGFTKYLDEVNKVANSSRGYVHSVEKSILGILEVQNLLILPFFKKKLNFLQPS